MAEERRTVYLVDGSGYIFRAFFALPQLNNSRGLPTNASFGFIRMLLKLLKDARPSHIAVVFDSPRKTFRDDLFESYKANRTAPPSDLVVQIPYIHRAVDAFRIPSIMLDGYEADDVIGTLAVRAAQDRFNAVIVTGDKDFMQLVGPNISLWDTMRDKRTAVREVRERFGVEPRVLVDVMALMGDAIDNIKGVPGIGEKTASALLRHYGSLEALFAGLDSIEDVKIRGAKKFADLIAQNRANVELARKLVRIDTEVPLTLAPADLEWRGIDHKAVADLLRELEFGSLLAELTPAEAAIPRIEREAEIHVDADRLDALLEELRAAPRLSLALVSEGGKSNGELPFGKPFHSELLKLKGPGQAPTYVVPSALIARTASLLSTSVPKACHDFKDHLVRLRRCGIELNGVEFDTMLAAFLVNPGRPEPSLETVYHEHLAPLGGSTPAGSEPAIVEALCERLGKRLDDQDLTTLFREIELPVARILADMERSGIAVDAAALHAISLEFAEELRRLERECYEFAGREFNLGSPAQLRQVLFNDLKLSAKGLKKTKTGYSTDADALEKLAQVHQLPARLLEYRTIAKLKSTYSDALAALIDPADGRLHTSFHQALTATGRLSSSQPNLQNIPTRTEEGRRIRRAFVPRSGFVLISADYSQIELRVLAHLSGDPTLIDAFTRGEDIHTRTAAEVLGINADKGAGEARRLAKVINFGIIYGMGPVRLAAELGISLTEASDYIKRYFERMPGVRQYVEETLRSARERGYVTTMYGRRRYLPELNAPDGGARAQAERIAVNTPIQGTAADLIKLAMVRCDALLRQRELRARMLLQVHDELLTESSSDSVDETCAVLREAMEGAASLKVPLKVALNWGLNWAELESHA